jgi:hypothetical protein
VTWIRAALGYPGPRFTWASRAPFEAAIDPFSLGLPPLAPVRLARPRSVFAPSGFFPVTVKPHPALDLRERC